VGWNFGFIGATALLTECYRPSERAKVQALNDFLVFGTVAVASFGSGQLLHSAGWNGINIGMLPLVAVVLVLLLHSSASAGNLKLPAGSILRTAIKESIYRLAVCGQDGLQR
jgi:hypothetical protein